MSLGFARTSRLFFYRVCLDFTGFFFLFFFCADGVDRADEERPERGQWRRDAVGRQSQQVATV